MTARLRNGLVVAVLHVAMVGSLGAKLVVDRATRPRAWAPAAPVDPELPIRGRYVRLRLEATLEEGLQVPAARFPVTLGVRNQRLAAWPAQQSSTLWASRARREGENVARLQAPLAFFIPEHVADPSRRAPGEELWVEVTLPRVGAPRPIRLGVKRNGVLTPLDLR
jgi:hypothetical protein